MSKCWYCNEELTTANYYDEHIGICTKCYGSMFKASNEFVKGLTDKIADLEAKLAELNKEPLNCSQLENGMSLCVIQKSEIAKLKQQLEEHSKHHEWVSEFLERYKIDTDSTPEYSKNPMIEYCEQVYDFRLCDDAEIKDLTEQLAEKDKEIAYITKQAKKFNNEAQKYYEDAYCNDTIYQDKISFAVEQLEKVKEEIGNNISPIIFQDSYWLGKQTVLDKIDNQIKALKEGK